MRKFSLIFGVLFMISAWSAAQSLGELAREQRAAQKPHASKVYTNDEMPSVPEQKDAEADSKEKADVSKKEADAKDTQDTKKNDADADAKKKAAEALKASLAEKEKSIALMQKEMDLKEREWSIRPHDAGGKWFTDENKHQDEMNAMKKQIDAEKAKLAEMTEQARKAGVTP